METKDVVEELEKDELKSDVDSSCECDNECSSLKEENKECCCDDKKYHHNGGKHHKNCDKKLKDEIKRLEEENKSLAEKIKLSQAELINYRKRKDDEVSNRLKYANQDLVMELIPIIDNFERAIKLDDDDLTDEVSKFLAGFKMMYASLTEIMKKFGVEEICRIGEEFDPNLEQALMTESNPDVGNDLVVDVLLKGYKLKDRVIRPASVKINKLD